MVIRWKGIFRLRGYGFLNWAEDDDDNAGNTGVDIIDDPLGIFAILNQEGDAAHGSALQSQSSSHGPCIPRRYQTQFAIEQCFGDAA